MKGKKPSIFNEVGYQKHPYLMLYNNFTLDKSLRIGKRSVTGNNENAALP